MPGQRGNSGGKKGRSGRKPKAVEMGLQALLDKCWTPEDREECLKALAEKASGSDMDAIKLLMSYAYGKPVDRKEISGGEGQPLKILVEYVSDTADTDN